jgi:hypothetical protein
MSVRLAAVTAVTASLFASALPAASADLYQPPYEPRGDAYYDEGPVPYDRYDRYVEREPDHPVPPRSVYGGKGFAPPSEWSGYRPRVRYEDDCVPRRIARARLREDGWRDFHDFERRGDVVLVRARRRSGRLFDLTIDRCSGEVVDARRLRGRRDFAYRPPRY